MTDTPAPTMEVGADGQLYENVLPAPSGARGQVIEVVPRGTRPIGMAGEGGSAPELSSGDLGSSYAGRLQEANAAATMNFLRSLAGGDGTPGEGGTPAQGGAPAAPAAAPGAPAADRAGWLGNAVDAAGRAASTVGDVTGQALVGGPLGAFREVFRAADDIGNWITRTEAPAPGQATMAANPGRAIADALPQYPEPNTPAGRVARDLSQFLVGFAGGNRAIRAAGGGARAATRAGIAAEAMGAGAVADFFAMPAHRERLADIWRTAGLPENALTEFLATNPEDEPAVARLRSTIEGAALGGAVEGLIAVARGFRAAAATGRPTARQATEAQRVLQQQQQQLVERATAPLGDPSGPLMQRAEAAVSEATQAVGEGTVARAAASAPRTPVRIAGGEFFVNWARISAPDDVQAVIRDMADAFREGIEESARFRQSNAATRDLANRLGMTVEDILSRQRGQPWNAETALAARELLNASAEQVLTLARAASAPNAGPAEAFAFRRMMAVHYAIQAEVMAARRETARALQSWAIPAGTNAEAARAVQLMIEQGGGMVTAQALARRAEALSGENVSMFARAAAMSNTVGRAVQEAWINALLSSPKTHIVNMTSNAFVMAQQVFERRLAEELPGSAVQAGEAYAMTYGLVTGLRDAFRLAGRAWRDDTGELAAMLGRVDIPRDPAIGSQALGLDAGGGLGRAVDFVGSSVVRAPSRALGAEDAFFRSLNFRMELHAGALRMAREEATIAGTAAPGTREFAEQVAERMRALVDNPTEELRIAAADQAAYATFNREAGRYAQTLMGVRERVPGVTFVLPFIRTPMNILSYTFERTPLAPLVGQWRADVAAGGVRRDLAITRLATGSAIMAVAMDMADRGLIIGNSHDDPGERENLRNLGAQPYSIRIGDRWYAFDRLDPLGFLFGFAADMSAMFRRREIEPEEVDEVGELMAAGISTVAGHVLDRTWMQGLSAILEAGSEPERRAEAWINRFAGSFVPAVVAQAESIRSPARSMVNSPADAVYSRIPVLSDSLPPQRNRWGEIIAPEPYSARGVFDAFSPVRVSDVRESPADLELERLNLNVQRIPRRVEFDGGAQVNLSAYPNAYDDYVRLAGNDWKDPITGLGLRDTIAEMVQGRGPYGDTYASMSDGREGGKAIMIRAMIQQFRAGARQALLEMPAHADLARVVRERQQERVTQRTPPEMR